MVCCSVAALFLLLESPSRCGGCYGRFIVYEKNADQSAASRLDATLVNQPYDALSYILEYFALSTLWTWKCT